MNVSFLLVVVKAFHLAPCAIAASVALALEFGVAVYAVARLIRKE